MCLLTQFNIIFLQSISSRQRHDSDSRSDSQLVSNRNKKDEKKPKKSRWREKHQEFLRAIRAAKGTSNGKKKIFIIILVGGLDSKIKKNQIKISLLQEFIIIKVHC